MDWRRFPQFRECGLSLQSGAPYIIDRAPAPGNRQILLPELPGCQRSLSISPPRGEADEGKLRIASCHAVNCQHPSTDGQKVTVFHLGFSQQIYHWSRKVKHFRFQNLLYSVSPSPMLSVLDAANVGKHQNCKSSALHGYLFVSMKTPKPVPILPTKRRFNHETFPRLWFPKPGTPSHER